MQRASINRINSILWAVTYIFSLLIMLEIMEFKGLETQEVIKQINVKLLPKQYKFVNSKIKENLYSGAFGAGKTRALAVAAVKKAMYPNNVVGLSRKTLTSLKATTLRVLLEKDGNLPPVLPLGTYKHNKTDHRILLYGGGEILYFGFDDPLRIGSLNLGSCFIDEGIELDKDEYMMILGRLRNNADPYRQLGIATNPGSPTHYLHKRFFQEKHRDRALFQTTSMDNFFLPLDYIEMLKGFTGQYRDRFVLGKWVAFEGLIYDNFHREINVVHRDLSEFKYFIIGVDEGYQDPAVLSLWGVDTDGRMHLFALYYKRNVLEQDFVARAKVFGLGHSMGLRRYFVYDPSAAGLAAAMQNAGLEVIKAKNAVFEGIQTTRDMIAVAKDGRPRLSVEPGCPGFEQFMIEIESYHYKANDKPADGLDHAMDTMRYVAMHLKNDIAPQFGYLDEKKETHPDEDEDKEYRENLHNRLIQRDEIWA